MNNFFIRDNDQPIYHIKHEPKSESHHTSNSSTTNTFTNAENFYPPTDPASDFVPSPTPSSLSTAKTSLFSRSVYQHNTNNTNTNNSSKSSSNIKLSGNKDQLTSALPNSASTSTSSAISTLASATVELTTSIPPSAHILSQSNSAKQLPYTKFHNSDTSKSLPLNIHPSQYMSKESNPSERHAYKHNTYYQEEEEEEEQQQQIENNDESQLQLLQSNYNHFNHEDNNNNNNNHHHHLHHHLQRHLQPNNQHPSLDNYAQQKYIYNNLHHNNHYHDHKQHEQNSPNNNNTLINDNYPVYTSKTINATESAQDYHSSLLYTNYPQHEHHISEDSFTTNNDSLRNLPEFTFPQHTNPSFTYPSLSTQPPIQNDSQLNYHRSNEFFDYPSSHTHYIPQTALAQSNINIHYPSTLTERNKSQTALYTDPSFQPPSRLSVSHDQTRLQVVKSSVPWTYKESKQLMRLREKGLTWKQISQSFKNRTLNACQFKWKRIMMNGGIEFSDDENDENDNENNENNDDDDDDDDDDDENVKTQSKSSDGTLKERDGTIERLSHPIFTTGSDSSSVGMKRSSESEAEETEIKRHKLGVSLSQIYNSSGSIPLRYSLNQSHRVRQPIPGSVFASESSFSSGPSNTEIESTPCNQEQEKEDDFLDFSGV
ncbi:hypothetical protein CANINC_000136 [Pichia inconspicua]|uniref:Myb-like domain-containing protein n=1 Tax=Pichia inconspicua TaxID=52247 RepID=A0A4T0X7C8_9ASCO|nr:hypothetical protein CANINC_000136 [[Candida] inconspicua]